MKRIITIFILIFTCISIFAQTQKYSRVKIFLDGQNIEKLVSLGIPLEGDYKKDLYIITEISQSDIQKLSVNAFNYEVLIDDMASYYVDRNMHPENYTTDSPKSIYCPEAADIYTTPSHFTLGSMGGFYTLDEMLAQLDSMREFYPNLISVKQQIDTTTSIQGRPLYYVRISDNPDVDESEPEVLYSALTHAREPMGMQQLIFYMWYLMENYGTNYEIKQLLDNTELYFVPMVNPDGYEFNCTNYPEGGGSWRKNRRNNGSGSFGVDLNRNYGYQWGYDDIGSSPNTYDDTYRGTAGFSEPETQTMKWFCENRQFVIAIDYHCYGNYLIYPWSNLEDYLTPDSLLFVEYSKLMTTENNFLYGTCSQTLNYVTNGGSIDWFYGEQSTKGKIIAFLPELGNSLDGFWPASSRIVDIAKENLIQNLCVARLAGKYAEVKDMSPFVISQKNGYIKFDIERLGLQTAIYTVSIQAVTADVLSVGSPKVFSGMNILETKTDSISFTLDPSTQSGDIVKFILKVDNGLYITSDTITKIYGQPVIIFNDNCTNTTNWNAGGWGVCTSQYHSASSSIADSPTGNYSNNADKSITLNNTIDLTDVVFAKLNFWTKWDIDDDRDYVQVKVSSDGGTSWVPLCGLYTNSGTDNQILDSPVYDGTQSSWVQEDIDLSDFLGQTIKLQFTLVSDYHTNRDGFYFDDVIVTTGNNSTVSITEGISGNVFISDPMPNPSGNDITFQYSFPESSTNPVITIYNELGQIVLSKVLSVEKGTVTFNIESLSKGVYYTRIISGEKTSELKKIIVM